MLLVLLSLVFLVHLGALVNILPAMAERFLNRQAPTGGPEALRYRTKTESRYILASYTENLPSLADKEYIYYLFLYFGPASLWLAVCLSS
jgi:hypothetical protein